MWNSASLRRRQRPLPSNQKAKAAGKKWVRSAIR